MRPASAALILRTVLTLAAALLGLGSLPARAQVNYTFEQHVHAVGQGQRFGDAMAFSGDHLVAADWNAVGNDVYVYARSGGQWVLQQAIDVPDWRPGTVNTATSTFGRLAIAGDMLVIGSPGDKIGGVGTDDRGSVRVYRLVGNTWTFQQRIDRPGSNSTIGSFGAAIAIDGNRMVVGAPNIGAYGTGAVFEFSRVGNAWSHVATIVPPDSKGISFGREIALRDDRLVVGQPRERRAFVYRRVGGAWQQEAAFAPGSNDPSIGFGAAVALSGDYAFVGAPGGPLPNGQAVHVFYRSNGVWGLVQRLNRPVSQSFGLALAANGDLLAAADPGVVLGDIGRVGTVAVFQRSGLYWAERQSLVYNQPQNSPSDDFGARVAVDGNTVMAARSLAAAPGAMGDTGQVVAFRQPKPKLQLSTPVEFGSIGIGVTSPARSLVLSNVGNASLTVSAIQAATAPFARVSGGTCGNLLPIVVPAGASCSIRYTFAPTVAGTVSRSLAFASNDPAGPQTAVLSGTGVAAQLAISPGDLFVGATVVGVPVGPATLTLQNVGAANLTVQSIGAPSAPFSVVAGGTCLAPPFTLSPGQSCTRRYQYSPTVTGIASAEFTITSTAANSPHLVSVWGSADGPGLGLTSGSSLDFGASAVGAPSATLSQTLFSAGVSDLTVQAITPPPAPFERVGGSCATPPFTLPPDVSCSLVYRFSPEALGPVAATIAVESDAVPAVTAFELLGEGAVPALLIGNNPLDLGGAKLGQTTATHTATLANAGNVSLSITSIASASAPFERVGGTCTAPPFSLGAGASCTLEYRFTADALGAFAQPLAISSNAPDSPATLELLARGTVATLAVAPTLLDFGTVAAGALANAPMTLSNTGSEPISITVLGPAAAPFEVTAGECPEPPFVLPEGGSCAVNVRFAPTAIGLFEATPALIHTADNGPSAISLRGRSAGSAPLLSPSALDFGSLAVGDVSTARTVTVMNTAAVPITIGTAILVGGLDFALSGDSCSGQTLPVAGACQLQLRFAPAALGAALDLLSLPSDTVGSPQQIEMEGLGVEPQIFRDGFESPP